MQKYSFLKWCHEIFWNCSILFLILSALVPHGNDLPKLAFVYEALLFLFSSLFGHLSAMKEMIISDPFCCLRVSDPIGV